MSVKKATAEAKPKEETEPKEETKPKEETAQNDDNKQNDEKDAADDEKKVDSSQAKKNEYPELDLVFLMDCTGSMGSYIQKGRDSIMNIVEKVTASEKADVRFAYIAYRDHPPQDRSFITKVHDFTKSTKDMRHNLSLYNAQGGGDGPEAVTEALHEALKLNYRKNAIKIAVIIADAPPHGLGCSGDGFPDGNPNGYDPVKIAKEMATNGIILYVIACEPSLSNFKGAHDLMAGLTEITEGRYLPLTGAHLLPDVIIGGAKEEVSLQKLEAFVDNQVSQLEKENPHLTEDEIHDKVTSKMNSFGYTHTKNCVAHDEVYGAYDKTNISMWSTAATSLADGRKKEKKLKQPKANFGIKQQQKTFKSKMDKESVGKLARRAKKKKGGW